MAEISDAQLGVIDDALTAIQQGLGDQSQSPEAQQIMELIVSAQQVVSSLKGETAGDTGAPSGNSSQSISASLAGGAAMTMEMCMASGKTQEECQAMMDSQQMGAAGEMSMDDFKQMAMHMQEAMNIMSKVMQPNP